MAEYSARPATPAARSANRAFLTPRLSLGAAVAAALALGSPAQAQSTTDRARPSSERSASRRALVSRPRWEVNGSSIAPAAIAALPERSASPSAPRASYAWLGGAATEERPQVGAMPQASGRAGLGARTVTAPPSMSEPSVVMSVTAPGDASSQGTVTMRIEVPRPGSSAPGTTGGVFVGRLAAPSAGSLPVTQPAAPGALGGAELSPREKAQQEARDLVTRQKQFELALANKKRIDAEEMARALADSERVTKRNRVARADLAESVRDLDQFRSILQKAFLDAGPDATGLNPFVRTAQRYAGTPYVWGGESRNGFDCSGFIMVVMRDLGYKALPHSAAEQFNYGMPVARGLLKPGDLVFFANTYKPGISHVGIYLGGGRFIHAAGTGKGTIVSHLASSPFAEKYAGGRRLFRNRA